MRRFRVTIESVHNEVVDTALCDDCRLLRVGLYMSVGILRTVQQDPKYSGIIDNIQP